MPQIYVKFGENVQDAAQRKGFSTVSIAMLLDTPLSRLVAESWGVPLDDVAFSAEDLVYTRGEADIQIEVRYTAGTDEYGRGEPFDPTEDERKSLAAKIQNAAEGILAGDELNVSVWVKPLRASTFRTAKF